MDTILPPVILVRRLLRQQHNRHEAFRGWVNANYDRDWASGDVRGKRRAERIYRLAEEFEGQLTEVGAFAVQRCGALAGLKHKTETGLRAEGYTLWPVTYGQNIAAQDPAFTEQTLMLIRLGCHFTSAKAIIYEAPMLLSWTRHALERLCERLDIGNYLEDILLSATLELGRLTSLAIALDLTKCTDDGDIWSETLWIPFKQVLVVVTRRVSSTRSNRENFGWRMNYHKNKLNTCIVKPALLVTSMVEYSGEEHPKESYQDFSFTSVTGWSFTTFISLSQLSSDQLLYRQLFTILVEILIDDTIDKIFMLEIDPKFTGNKIELSDLLESTEVKNIVKSLSDSLSTSAFEARSRSSLNEILNNDLSSGEYRKLLDGRKLRSED